MSGKTETTKKLTSIFPIGFEGDNTEVATEEDNKRMKAWGEAMNQPQTTGHKPGCICIHCEDALDALLRRLVYRHGGFINDNADLSTERREVREVLNV